MEEKIMRVEAGTEDREELKQVTNANRSGTWFLRLSRNNLVRTKRLPGTRLTRSGDW